MMMIKDSWVLAHVPPPLQFSLVSNVICPRMRTPGGSYKRSHLGAQIIDVFQRWGPVMVDFVTHQSAAGYQVLLHPGSTGPTGLSRCQAASECLTPPPLPAGPPSGYVQPENEEYSLLDW